MSDKAKITDKTAIGVKYNVMRIYLFFCRFLLNLIKSQKLTLKIELFLGFIKNDLSPKKCKYCGSMEFYENISDKMENIVMEKECYCNKCNKIAGYWVTGCWMP